MATVTKRMTHFALVGALLALMGASTSGAYAASGPDHRLPRRGGCENGAGTISGTVTDANGSAVEGARVYAHIGAAPATTVADGSYQLTGVCLGEMIVVAVKRDVGVGAYDADGDGTPDKVTLSAATPNATGIHITLALKPHRPDRVKPPAACENGAGTISGTVTDASGNPVEGAKVHLAGRPSGRGPRHGAEGAEGEGPSAVTAADGTYQISGLCSGAYGVQAGKEGVGRGAYDADGDGTPDRVRLTDDAPNATGINITLKMIVRRPR